MKVSRCNQRRFHFEAQNMSRSRMFSCGNYLASKCLVGSIRCASISRVDAGAAPSSRRRALPSVEGPRERIEFFEPEYEGDLACFEIGARQEPACGFPTHFIQQALIARPLLLQASLERSQADAQIARDLVDRRPLAMHAGP